MAYDLYLVPVPAGGDVEEAGEALLARLAGADEVPGDAEGPARTLVDALRAADPTVCPAPQRGGVPPAGNAVAVVGLRATAGIEVAVARTFARFRVPFEHRGEDAEAVFERLFRLLAVASSATGWLAYDPQEAAAAALDDSGREEALEIYLSVMDQIRPSGPGPGGDRSVRASG